MTRARDDRKRNQRWQHWRERYGPECPRCGKRENHYIHASLGEPAFYLCELTTEDVA